ncbi:fimbrial protein [Aeromonas sp. CA23]|uniref:fimbrial protein n=1 Tax=Aeromonas sp. CA23 TaxID=2033032 RepID=UPI000BFC0A90|nr:fimbrial protein [Aeromonas sp. CA23]ATM00997.1 fimbrial protein [Aeromonas sp. CA23]
MSVAKMSAIAAVVVMSASMNANAASSNTIQFQGEVTEQTCSVAVNGQASTPTVLLPTVSIGELTVGQAAAKDTRFTIGLTGCSAPASAQNIKTVFVGNNLTAEGRLGNTGTATGVSLQIVDPKDGVQLDLNGAGIPGLVLQPGESAASYDFAVKYFADAAPTAGSVLGSLQYAVSYL